MPYSKTSFLRFILVLLLSIAAIPRQAAAQAENYGSPYSRFALGDQQPLSLAHHRGMGGVTTAVYDSVALNLANPAALSDLKLTNIEFGAIGNISALATNTAKQYRSNFNFGYLMLGFPVTKRWGTAIGFQPYAFTNYNIRSQVDSSFNTWEEAYNGRGGINQLSWSNGVKVAKGLHLGATASFLFGTINQERLFFFPHPDSLFLFNVRNSDLLKVNDVQLSFGMQYRVDFKYRRGERKGQLKGRSMVFGLTADLPTLLNGTSSFVSERFTTVGSAIRVVDTVSNRPGVQGTVQLPMSLSAGLSYNIDNKLLVATEMRYTEWSQFNIFGRPDSLQNSLQLAAGVQYIPKYDAIGKENYWQTIRYRAGLKYNSGSLVLKEQSINEVGMTFGVGLPMKRALARPYLNLSAEIGSRGTLTNGLVRERYTRLTLGLTLNDRWFIKRKYD